MGTWDDAYDVLAAGLHRVGYAGLKRQMEAAVASIWEDVGILSSTAGWRYEIQDADITGTEYNIFVATVVTEGMSGTRYHETVFPIRRLRDAKQAVYDIAAYLDRWQQYYAAYG